MLTQEEWGYNWKNGVKGLRIKKNMEEGKRIFDIFIFFF